MKTLLVASLAVFLFNHTGLAASGNEAFIEKCLADFKDFPDQFYCDSEGELPYHRGPFKVRVPLDKTKKKQFQVRSVDYGQGPVPTAVSYVYKKKWTGKFKNYPNITFKCPDGKLEAIEYQYDHLGDVTHSYPTTCGRDDIPGPPDGERD